MDIPLYKADADLSKVISFEKRQELYNILHSEDPDHYSRLWLVGFLKFCGYSIEEICAIIHHEASWADYDDVEQRGVRLKASFAPVGMAGHCPDRTIRVSTAAVYSRNAFLPLLAVTRWMASASLHPGSIISRQPMRKYGMH